MVHNEVFKHFKSLFPTISENAQLWFPNGKNSIRVRQNDGREFVFTYSSQNDWRFETSDYFIKRTMKVGEKQCAK